MTEIILAMGIPSAVMGIFVWLLKRHIDKTEKRREAREQKTEQVMLLIMRNSRATAILAEATAKAVQRIPDAKCNGDMTKALEDAEAVQKEEKDFMFNQGIEHIFGTFC